MKCLVKYELLKILRKKSTLIIMAVSLLITAVFFGLPVIQFQTYNQDGVLKGLEGIRYEREQYADISVPLTDEYVTETVREVQELFENPDNVGYDGNEQFLIEDAYWDGIAPREGLLNVGVIYLVLCAMIGLTLLLSTRMKSPYLVLIVVVPVLFIPMFLAPNGTAGVYNLLIFLTPYQSLIPGFGRYVSYQFGPLILDSFSMRALVYAVLTAVLIPFAGRGFKRHQVA